MTRLTISREQFQAAIEAGIESAGGKLDQKYVDRLRRLGKEARTVSGNYHGCPATRVKAVRPDPFHAEPGAHLFVDGYDTYIITQTDAGDHWTRGHNYVANKYGEELYFIQD